MKLAIALWLTITLSLVQPGLAQMDPAAYCIALVDKGFAMFKEKGKDATLAAIRNSKGPFVRGDIYLFALSLDNIMLAHPHDKSLHGIDMSKVRDRYGRRFFERFSEIAANPGSGWADYTWNKPHEKVPSPKRSYIKRVPGEDVYLGCGYYLDK